MDAMNTRSCLEERRGALPDHAVHMRERLIRWMVSLSMLVMMLNSTGWAAPVTLWGQDDWNTSSLTPPTPTYVDACPWLDTGLQNAGFTLANGWQFSYVFATGFVQRDVRITIYDPWVVTSPNVAGLDGVVRNRGVTNEDAGGLVFQLRYDPFPGDPTNIHFLQAYNESFNGGASQSYLDNNRKTNLTGKPWYDEEGVSGIKKLANPNDGNAVTSSWFQDTPYDKESQIFPPGQGEGNELIDPYSNVQFQVFVAVDNGAVAGTGIDHDVKIYGGYWYGYNYETFDPVPLPSAFCGGGFLLCVFALRSGLRNLTGNKFGA
jgi:hypothetical protein